MRGPTRFQAEVMAQFDDAHSATLIVEVRQDVVVLQRQAKWREASIQFRRKLELHELEVLPRLLFFCG